MVALLDELELQGIKLLGFDQHLLPHADLAEIMEQAGIADLLDLLPGERHAAIGAVLRAVDDGGESHRHVGDPSRVAEGGRVPLLDRVHRGPYEPLKQPLDLLVQPAVFDRDRRLSGERGHELHGALRVRHDLLLHVRRRREHRFGMALAVDQLEDADDFFLVILHRDDEHRLGAVAVTLVEGAVDAVLHVGRQEVRVVHHEGLARHRRIAREARAVHGNGEFDEGRLGLGEGLRVLEPQALLPLLARLDEVEAARVRGGDTAGLLEDLVE